MSLLWEQMHRPIVSLQRCFSHAEGLCFLLLTGARLSTGQNGEQIIAQQSAVPGTTRSRGKLWCTLWRPSAWRPLGSQGMVCLCGLGVSVTQWTRYNSAPSCKQLALRMSMGGGQQHEVSHQSSAGCHSQCPSFSCSVERLWLSLLLARGKFSKAQHSPLAEGQDL